MEDRGILTERDREILAEEPNNDRQYQIKNRIKYRIENVEKDLDIIYDQDPKLAEEIRKRIGESTEQNHLKTVLDDIQNEIADLRMEVADNN
jgi:hypothetical protein